MKYGISLAIGIFGEVLCSSFCNFLSQFLGADHKKATAKPMDFALGEGAFFTCETTPKMAR